MFTKACSVAGTLLRKNTTHNIKLIVLVMNIIKPGKKKQKASTSSAGYFSYTTHMNLFSSRKYWLRSKPVSLTSKRTLGSTEWGCILVWHIKCDVWEMIS